MSFSATLPPIVIAQLYKNALLTNTMRENQEDDGSRSFGKKVAIGVAGRTHPIASDMEFISKVLEACKLDPGDVAVFGCNEITPIAYLNRYKPEKLIVFGPVGVDFGTSLLTPLEQDGCTILMAPPMTDLMQGAESKALKSRLWKCLKSLFGLS